MVDNFNVLSGSMGDFLHIPGANLLNRTAAFYNWQQARRQAGFWPYGRSTENGPHSRCLARTDDGDLFEGVNFASQDYLSLSSHPEVLNVAIETIQRFGVHSAGAPAFVGNTSLSLALENKIAEFLSADHIILYPTGWAAGFGVIQGLVRSNDHIVMDKLSHFCLQQGARAATKNVHFFRHNNLEMAREKLQKIRASDTENGILVVTESLFSMDSDSPDLKALQELAHEFNATLVVDVAHDLGSLGENGRGHLEVQNMIGKIDVIMGSFSKTFASSGGFVATSQRSVKEYLRYFSSPNIGSNALSPSQAAIVGKCFDIAASGEGVALRRKLMNNVMLLRQLLNDSHFDTYGEPSPIVSVKIASESLARLVSRCLPTIGLLSNLVEFPAVAKGAARFRFQVMANHTNRDITDGAHFFRKAMAIACTEDETLKSVALELAELTKCPMQMLGTQISPATEIKGPRLETS